MLTLPDAIVAVLIPFAALFQNRTGRKAQVLLVGAILSPGQRTVAAALRVMGLSGDRNYARYHHVLNRAAWSPLEVSQVLVSPNPPKRCALALTPGLMGKGWGTGQAGIQ